MLRNDVEKANKIITHQLNKQDWKRISEIPHLRDLTEGYTDVPRSVLLPNYVKTTCEEFERKNSSLFQWLTDLSRFENIQVCGWFENGTFWFTGHHYFRRYIVQRWNITIYIIEGDTENLAFYAERTLSKSEIMELLYDVIQAPIYAEFLIISDVDFRNLIDRFRDLSRDWAHI